MKFAGFSVVSSPYKRYTGGPRPGFGPSNPWREWANRARGRSDAKARNRHGTGHKYTGSLPPASYYIVPKVSKRRPDIRRLERRDRFRPFRPHSYKLYFLPSSVIHLREKTCVLTRTSIKILSIQYDVRISYLFLDILLFWSYVENLTSRDIYKSVCW